MTRNSGNTLTALFTLALLSLLGCTEGGGSVAATGGMSGTGISQGTISSFGSIFVNDVGWDLGGALVEVDGTTGSESDLRVGMVVRVLGTRDAGDLTGSADEVRFDLALAGPLASDPTTTIPAVEERFEVLGRTVIAVAGETVFAGGASFGSLRRDDVVEVSGYTTAGGELEATRIEQIGAFPVVDEAETEGLISNLIVAGATGSFELDGILVRFDGTTAFEGTTAGTLANGDRVDLEGTLRVSGTEIDADEIELEALGLGVDDADEVELEGLVGNFVSPSSFVVEGVPVDATGATIEPSGAMIMDGFEVEVEGSLVGGVLRATEVEVQELEDDDELIEIIGEVSSIDGGAREITILGIVVPIDASAVFEDDTGATLNFGFDDLVVGDWLELLGDVDSGGGLEILFLTRTSPEDDIEILAPVEALDRVLPGFDLLGLPVPLFGGTSYFDEAENARTAAQFFGPPGDLDEGSLVRVIDEDAVDASQLLEADIVEVEMR